MLRGLVTCQNAGHHLELDFSERLTMAYTLRRNDLTGARKICFQNSLLHILVSGIPDTIGGCRKRSHGVSP
ncbi:MAG: hypothetical protein OEZ03_02075, partial [Alphaproteobacteria bacterium]|nr:hypothetical protein [Alphaproteobacteria bacterium]